MYEDIKHVDHDLIETGEFFQELMEEFALLDKKFASSRKKDFLEKSDIDSLILIRKFLKFVNRTNDLYEINAKFLELILKLTNADVAYIINQGESGKNNIVFTLNKNKNEVFAPVIYNELVEECFAKKERMFIKNNYLDGENRDTLKPISIYIEFGFSHLLGEYILYLNNFTSKFTLTNDKEILLPILNEIYAASQNRIYFEKNLEQLNNELIEQKGFLQKQIEEKNILFDKVSKESQVSRNLKVVADMVATLNHELNNPLSTVIGYLQLVIASQSTGLDAKVLSKLKKALASANDIKTKIEKMTKISKIEVEQYAGNTTMLKTNGDK